MPDRPGSLAELARHCGEKGVNILGMQIFPGVVEGAGGTEVTVSTCTEHVLVDGPTQYLQGLRRVADDPDALDEVLATLLGADPVDEHGVDLAAVQDVLVVDVGARQVPLRRTAPFTVTERARAVAFAEVALELVGAVPEELGPPGPTPEASSRPVVRSATSADTSALMRMHHRRSRDSVYKRYGAPLSRIDERFARRLLRGGGGALVAAVADEVVAVASLSECDAGLVEVAILVEDGWQRRGVGTQLLSAAVRLARVEGAAEVVLRSRSHNPALMSLAFACGLRARIRLDGDTVVVTVGVDGLEAPTSAQRSGTKR